MARCTCFGFDGGAITQTSTKEGHALSEIVEHASAELRAPTELDQWVLVVRDISRLASQISDTEFVPQGMRGNPAAVTAAILTGREMGLAPMTALQHIHVIKGKPGKSAEIMRALVLSAGHEIREIESTDTRVILEGRRRGEEQWTRVQFTADQAKRAKIDLGGYPEDKLYARATSRLCRRKFADVVGGIAATIDELEDTPDDETPSAPPKSSTRTRTAKRRTPVTRASSSDATRGNEPESAPSTPEPPPLPGDADEQPEAGSDDDSRAGEKDSEYVSREQLDKMHAQLTELSISDRGDKLTTVGLLIGRQLETSKHMSKLEATQVIDILSRVLATDDPSRALDAVLGELENAEQVSA